MKVEFQDYYGQHVAINNETSSGNVRIKVNTLPNLNDVAVTEKSKCTLETDVSLDMNRIDLLIATLKTMRDLE